MLICDLNCDTGEGTGNEEQLMPFITSANIACGFHAGDQNTMKRMVDLCLQHGVAIGAHPSYPDRENFGRKELMGITLKPEDVYHLVSEQVYILSEIAKRAGAVLHHVKAHGALYNRAAWDSETGYFLCKAIAEIDPHLLLYGLSGSTLKNEAEKFSIKFVHEVFADRTYQDDSSLTPRTQPDALIEDEIKSIEQILQIVNKGSVKTVTGKTISIEAGTICLHGDGKHAVTFAKGLHQQLIRR